MGQAFVKRAPPANPNGHPSAHQRRNMRPSGGRNHRCRVGFCIGQRCDNRPLETKAFFQISLQFSQGRQLTLHLVRDLATASRLGQQAGYGDAVDPQYGGNIALGLALHVINPSGAQA